MKLPVIIIVTAWVFWVFISFFMISIMADVLKEKHPSLIDKRWKRLLWLLSSIFLIPILAFIPYYAVEAMREFISGDRNKKRNLKAKTSDNINQKPYQLDIDQVDEINSHLSFVSAVLDSFRIMGLVSGNTEIKGETLIHLALEAKKRMEQIDKIINIH